jgi:hypothetical protein
MRFEIIKMNQTYSTTVELTVIVPESEVQIASLVNISETQIQPFEDSKSDETFHGIILN